MEASVEMIRFNRRMVILLTLTVLYSSAWLLPKAVIPSGLEGLTPGQEGVAETAKALAMTGSWEKWFEKLWITRLKTEVLSAGTPQEFPWQFPRGWVVRVTAYSLFGIEYGQLVFTNEDGLSENVESPGNASGPLGLLAVAACTLAACILWPWEGPRAPER
jgi:hypothetical protein